MLGVFLKNLSLCSSFIFCVCSPCFCMFMVFFTLNSSVQSCLLVFSLFFHLNPPARVLPMSLSSSLTHFSPLLQDIEETMNTALNELRELERQSSAKHAPDVVLDTLEQRQTSGSSGGGPTPASSSESLSPIHGVMLRSTANTEPPARRSTSSSNDSVSTFKPVVAPRMGVQLKPPALRPKPMVLPKSNQAPQPPANSSQDPLDKSCTM